jgi:ribosomal protein S18 acetylase RimI-like enzyme
VLLAGLFRLGAPAVVRYLRFRRLQEAVDIDRAPDSHYVVHLNVHPKCRSRGIGALLLAEAERQARKAGLKRLSLTMYISNPAQHLYERTGYRVVETRTDPAFERMVGVPGYALMVKELE